MLTLITLFSESQAFGYQNQPEVGKAIDASGVARSKVFVTTKINPHECTAEAALAAVKVDVQQLGVGAVDLVLQHFPCRSAAQNQAVWSGLNQAKEAGLTRAIGVSHYTKKNLQDILSLNKGERVSALTNVSTHTPRTHPHPHSPQKTNKQQLQALQR
jgi:diketogulonate reductase-like aldo/keto reductase